MNETQLVESVAKTIYYSNINFDSSDAAYLSTVDSWETTTYWKREEALNQARKVLEFLRYNGIMRK